MSSTRSSPDALREPVGTTTAYRRGLRRYRTAALRRIAHQLRVFVESDPADQAAKLPGRIETYLCSTEGLGASIHGLDQTAHVWLGVIAVVGSESLPELQARAAIRMLGGEPDAVLEALLIRGLIVVLPPPIEAMVEDPLGFLRDHPGVELAIAPILLDSEFATDLPVEEPWSVIDEVEAIRCSDGLEPLLRLAVLWQRIASGPARLTQNGQLYKRDRDRIFDDPTLTNPIADALRTLPETNAFWFDLALEVGLLRREDDPIQIVAAPADFWEQARPPWPIRIASAWLSLGTWNEVDGLWDPHRLSLARVVTALRAVALLRLLTVGSSGWVALSDLAARIGPDTTEIVEAFEESAVDLELEELLRGILLGPAYLLGLVEVGTSRSEGREVIRATATCRALWRRPVEPDDPASPEIDRFLMIQPNHQVIAYRQGLTPSVIGRLSEVLRWSQVGAALELELDGVSAQIGLERGLDAEAILKFLQRHSIRDLPASVVELVKGWSSRRERITYFRDATLLEFADEASLEAALAQWIARLEQSDDEAVEPIRVADRILLVADTSAIPFDQFRLTGSRDYRRPPESCVEVEPDGLTLALDPSRSDLLVEGELGRFADPLPVETSGNPRRRYRLTHESLGEALASGFGETALIRWFRDRADAELPPAVALMIHARLQDQQPLRTRTVVVLQTPSPELLDGLLQHPLTRPWLDTRLGPTSVEVRDDGLTRLTEALHSLGIRLDA